MFLRGAARRGLLRAILPWERSHVVRGFGAAALSPEEIEKSIPGFKPLWSKVECATKANPVKTVTEWKAAGNEVTKELITAILCKLCRRGWFAAANQLANWIDEQGTFELTQEDLATRLRITNRLNNTEKKLADLSKSFQHKDEATYISFLEVYVIDLKRELAERLFEELKKSKLMVTARAYTLMVQLYVRSENEAEAVRVFNEYEASGLPLDADMYSLLLYNREIVSSIPVEEKARAALETLETTTANRKDMMKLHAFLGHAEEVDIIWQQMLANPPILRPEYLAALASYDAIGNVTKAEEVSEKYSALHEGDGMGYKHSLAMLRLYARHGKLDRALEMQAELMASKPHFAQAHPIIDAYLKQGDLQKAVQCYHTYMSRKDRWNVPWRLVADSIVKLNKEFALTGDVKSAEKLMAVAPGLRYIRAYKSLMKVYLNAKMPAYGLRDRILAARVDDEAEMLLKQLASLDSENAENEAEAAPESKAPPERAETKEELKSELKPKKKPRRARTKAAAAGSEAAETKSKLGAETKAE